MLPFDAISLEVLVAGLVSFAGMLVLTPLVIRLARQMNWVAEPSADRWHERPTALMGGVAIFAAVVIGTLAARLWWTPWPLWGGAALMFAIGVVDDRVDVAPAAKLIAQIVAAGMLLYAGYSFAPEWPFWLAVPLTFIWVIGITNAINLLDNMDGLAAGVAAIASGVLAVMALMVGAPGVAVGALALTGASAGFLVFNFKPARIFMGDGGSLFLGYSIAALAVVMQSILASGGFSVYLVSIAVLAVPIFDTTLVTLARTRSGRKVSQGGRDHSSHRLVYLGLSERAAVLTLYAVSLLFGAVAFGYLYADIKLFYALLTFLLAGLGVLGVHLGRANVYDDVAASVNGNGASYSSHAPLMQRVISFPNRLLGSTWKPLMGVVVDVGLVVAAFTLAYFLRFENGITPEREAFLLDVLPLVVVIKLPVFYYFSLYKAIWRHAGTMELVRIGKASTVASVCTLAVLVLLYGASSVAMGVIVIDWMVTTLAVMGVRFGFRGLRQYLAARREEGGPTFIVGTGPNALAAFRAIRERSDMHLNPMGFLDTDPETCGRTLQDLPVHALDDRLHELCASEGVTDLVITDPALNEQEIQQIVQACLLADVRCHTFLQSIQPLDKPLYRGQHFRPEEAPGALLLQQRAS